MRAAILMSALMCVALLAGCAGSNGGEATETLTKQPLAANKGGIQGLLIDDRYRPVAGGKILVIPAGVTTTTDSLGQFQFVDLDPGTYTLKVDAQGHEAAPYTVDVVVAAYAELEIVARRITSEGSLIITTQYSVFVPCAASAPAISTTVNCLADQSGDSYRGAFTTDYTSYGKNLTVLITEMKSNKPASTSQGAYKVVVRDSGGGDPYFASKYTVNTDYIKLTMKIDTISEDDAEPGRNRNWTNSVPLQTAFFPQGAFKGESQMALNTTCGTAGQGCFESRGVGPQFGVKANFLQSAFIGPPEVDIAEYHVYAPS